MQIQTKFIALNAVTGAQLRLNNADPLRARNAANTADVNLLELDSSNNVEAFALWIFENAAPQTASAPAVGNDITNKTYVDAQVAAGTGANKTLSNLTSPVAASQSLLPGVDNSITLGIAAQRWATLSVVNLQNNGAGGAIAVADPITMAAQINSQSIVPNTTATYNLGSSSVLFAASFISQMNTGTVSHGTAGALTIQTVSSGTGINVNTVAGNISLNPSTHVINANSSNIQNVLDPVSAQDAATKHYVDTAISTNTTPGFQQYALTSTDITNQFYDLAQIVSGNNNQNSLAFTVSGVSQAQQITGGGNASPDYSVSVTGGVGGVTRVSFLNGLATGGVSALVAGDIIELRYLY